VAKGKGARRWLTYIYASPSPPRLAPLLNREIDRFFAPLERRSKVFVVADSLAHLMVEVGDTLVYSLYKTAKYNLRKLVD